MQIKNKIQASFDWATSARERLHRLMCALCDTILPNPHYMQTGPTTKVDTKFLLLNGEVLGDLSRFTLVVTVLDHSNHRW